MWSQFSMQFSEIIDLIIQEEREDPNAMTITTDDRKEKKMWWPSGKAQSDYLTIPEVRPAHAEAGVSTSPWDVKVRDRTTGKSCQ